MPIEFLDRLGNSLELPFKKGESVKKVLSRHFIPVDSVMIYLGDKIINEDYVLYKEDEEIFVRLIEGFDIVSLIKNLKKEVKSSSKEIYKKKTLSINRFGDVKMNIENMSPERLKEYVEEVFFETVMESRIMIGLF